MSNMVFSINVTAPIFLMILLGYFLKKIKVIDDNFVKVANKYVFLVALPVMLFKDIAQTDIIKDISAGFVIFCSSVTILMFLIIWLLSYLLIKDKTQVGAFAQAGARGSAAVLGVAFVENICGSAGMAPVMIVAAVPFFNILSVIILTFSADLGKDVKLTGESKALAKQRRNKNIRKACINICKNPIILGILAGLLFSISGLEMPKIPSKMINYISNTATPIALLAIGGGFNGKEALNRLKPAVCASIVKLIILPAAFIPVAACFGFGPSEMAAILVMLASPSTVSCYVMADNMGNDRVLTSNTILITTIMSSLTLTGWVYIMRAVGLL
ncbi:MAG: AEC family transporter [Ruminococcus sp.]|nr:AEC family transporter [Ruminococcus sp.]